MVRNGLAALVVAGACLGQGPVINPNGLVNGATGKPSSSVPVISRGSIVIIYGQNLANGTYTAPG
jgi:hypothetical protein